MVESQEFNYRKTIKIGLYLLGFIVILGMSGGFLTNAIYGWITGNWAPLVSGLASFGIGFTVGSASAAVAGATTLGAAMAALASALWPWGWILIGGILAGV